MCEFLESEMPFSPLAKEASMVLQNLKAQDRKLVIEKLADLMLERQEDILAANKRDVQLAKRNSKCVVLKNNYILQVLD